MPSSAMRLTDPSSGELFAKPRSVSTRVISTSGLTPAATRRTTFRTAVSAITSELLVCSADSQRTPATPAASSVGSSAASSDVGSKTTVPPSVGSRDAFVSSLTIWRAKSDSANASVR